MSDCTPGMTLQQYYRGCALCICVEPRRGHVLGSLGRGDHLVLPQQQPWWCEDTQMCIKAMLRGVTLGTLLKANKGPLAQWFKNKPLERSRILAMLQVPFPSTSEQQMDFFQQSHQLCIRQTKGTEEFTVLTPASSDSELPFPILEPRAEPGRTESSFTPARTHTEWERLASPKRVTVGLPWFQIKIVWWRYVYENIKYRKERQCKTHFPFYKAYLAFYKVHFPNWGMENCEDIESTQAESVSLNVYSIQSLQRTACCMGLQVTRKSLRQEWCSLLAWKPQPLSVLQT